VEKRLIMEPREDVGIVKARRDISHIFMAMA
jgi:hypothetical protein